MAGSDQDKDSDGAGIEDSIGRKRPRWPEPRPKSPIAVALDYKRPDGRIDAKQAPRVAATGRGAVAEQILEIAFAKGVPVREDPDLAQLLVTLDVDSVIPTEALAAVAEILAYLYRLNGRAMEGRLTPEDEGETGAKP
ncbi:MAG TPA: EscU/YscU/HrcU family type III secretion system export apparatus switch protein [Candidatus Cybelea sp.]|nr:EscU/YscU/HrcU family type III secretion system export apparatus switch protein [Candidatus Cybelea sp.]